MASIADLAVGWVNRCAIVQSHSLATRAPRWFPIPVIASSTIAGPSITVLPGLATVAGLALSRLPNDRFLFAGFLPSKDKARREVLADGEIDTTLVFYETTPRLMKALAAIGDVLPNRDVAIARANDQAAVRRSLPRPDRLLRSASHPRAKSSRLSVHRELIASKADADPAGRSADDASPRRQRRSCEGHRGRSSQTLRRPGHGTAHAG